MFEFILFWKIIFWKSVKHSLKKLPVLNGSSGFIFVDFFTCPILFISLLQSVFIYFPKKSTRESKLPTKYYVKFIILAQIRYQVSVKVLKQFLIFTEESWVLFLLHFYKEIEKRVQHLLKTYNHKFHLKK